MSAPPRRKQDRARKMPTRTQSIFGVIVASVSVSAWLCATPAVGAPVFPLKASANGHTLVDVNNVPFRLQGDSPWDLLVTITSSDVDTYLNNRSAKGFNTLLVELVEHTRYAAASPAPANRAGNRPFLSKVGGGSYTGNTDLADLSTPNDAYFAYVDTILAKIAAKNMVALLTPLYVGFGAPLTQSAANQGWSADMNANSAANCYKYGQYVGDRYRNQKNVLWMNGGDAFGLPAGVASCVQQVMQGIKDGKGSGGSAVLQTTQWSREHLSTDDAGYAVTLNSVYPSPGTAASLCRSGYARVPALPAYMVEGYYEGEHGMTRDQLRKQAYWSVLSCIGGSLFGNLPLWDFDSGWQAAMDAPGSVDWQRAGALLDSVAWSSLVPSNLGTLAGTVLVTGGADIASGGDVAAAASGSTLLAYLPSTGTGTRTLTVQMGVLGAFARGRWYNPTSGAYTDITGGAYTLANSGTHAFTTPGNNGTGTNDWVLVLDIRPPVQRTWVSSSGNDANDCSLGTPCRTLSTAIATTVNGGEVAVVDSAAYGPVTITKPVAVIAPPGIYAGISVLSGTGIIVNPGSGVVTLRGLTLNALGGAIGIDYQSGDALYIEQVSVAGFVTAGINAAPIATGNIFIRDSLIRDNAFGASFAPQSAGAPLKVSIDRVKFERNTTGARFSGNTSKASANNCTIVGGSTGILVQPSASTATTVVDVRKSTITGSTGAAVSAGNGTAGSTATVSLTGDELTESGTGLSVGVGGRAFVTDTTIRRNAVGIALTGGGTATSLHDNRLLNNTTNGAFSSTTTKL